ncbi:PKD domain-containing protein [Streptomyces sp. CB01881]|uniref:PKD domain-containing protein n=1 Tax=Streptomyces sp. CB01881 TaxID=2078691 RepID=UPI00138762EB|nr:PKD domain-containing protein [Streptomyces sp. CB01881]
MRLRHSVVLGTAIASAAVGLPFSAAAAEPPAVLYVDNTPSKPCDDFGTGSQAVPFCTPQAAVDAARPGQTVQLAARTWKGELRITRSGEPGRPIVINGSPLAPDSGPRQPVLRNTAGHAVRVSGAHDVVVRGLAVLDTPEPVLIENSSRVVMDQLYLFQRPTGFPEPPVEPGAATVRVTGTSDSITISRSVIGYGRGVVLDAGTRGTTVVGNDLSSNTDGAIKATDAVGTVVVNNTVTLPIGPGVRLAGASTGAVVENNVIIPNVENPGNGHGLIVVEAGAVAGTKVDYNVVHPTGTDPAYVWAGTAHRGPAELTAATGQGAHDLDSDIGFRDGMLGGYHRPTATADALIDSADPDAPGVLDTDMWGRAVVDAPHIANSGPHGSARDRGATEIHGLTGVNPVITGTETRSPQGPVPLTVEVSARPSNGWPTALTYTYDFKDGSAPLVTAEATVRHTYTAPGTFKPTVTAADGTGDVVSGESFGSVVIAAAPGPLSARLAVAPSATEPLGFSFTASATGPYRVTEYGILSFGDGGGAQWGPGNTFSHTYSRPGDYDVTLVARDEKGNSTSWVERVTAAYAPSGFTALSPVRVMDTRIPSTRYQHLQADNALSLKVRETQDGTSSGVPAGATAVVLNLTATGASGRGFLSTAPGQSGTSTTSNVNFAPGQDVSNLVTVPVGLDGEVSIGAHGASLDVVADVLGYYRPSAADKFTALAPARLLDTRETGGPIGQDGTRRLKVAGNGGVPATARSVILNVTATESTANSYVTVHPAGTPRPAAGSNLNTVPGRNITNQVVVPLGTDGSIDIYNHSGSSHAVVDVVGYFSPEGRGLFTPVLPSRLLDSRSGAPLGAGSVRTVTGVPAGATAAAVNLTATETTEATHLTAWATGTAKPGTSNLNATPGLDVPSHGTIPVDAQGRFDIANNAGSTHVVADLFGYYRNQ